jgi:putative peptidoglycan lipid II flippase
MDKPNLQKSALVAGWSSASVNRRIFAALVTVGVASLIVSLAGMLKELLVAHRFGRGDDIDAFLLAFLLPSFAVNVLAGTLNAAFIPEYVRTGRQQGRAAADLLFSTVSLGSIGVLLVGSAALALAAPHLLPLLASNFDQQKLALTYGLFLMLLPVLTISGISSLWTAALNAHQKYFVAALAPTLMPICATLFLLLLGGGWGIYALAAGTIAGFFLQCLVLVPALRRLGISVVPRHFVLTPQLRQVVDQYLPVASGALLMSGTMVVDQAMAAMLEPGSVAALNYGSKVPAFVVGMGIVALGSAVLPQFSDLAASGDWPVIRRTLRFWVVVTAIVSALATLLLIVASEFIVGLLFERGAFTAHDTRVVAIIQSLLLLQVPFHTVGIVFVRLLSALQQNRVVLWAAAINLPLNVLLNFLFMQWIGIYGIALSTAVVYAVSCTFLGWKAGGRLKRVSGLPRPEA